MLTVSQAMDKFKYYDQNQIGDYPVRLMAPNGRIYNLTVDSIKLIEDYDTVFVGYDLTESDEVSLDSCESMDNAPIPAERMAQLSEGFDAKNAEINRSHGAVVDNRIIQAMTDSVDKRKDYHEVHPDGSIQRGQIGDLKYEQVIRDGKVIYTVAVQDDLIGMFYDAETFAIVDIHTDTIVEGKSLGQVAENMREGFDVTDEQYHYDNGKLIVETAHCELGCPRWGMSW